MTSDKLNILIEKERNNLKKLKVKKTDLEDKIKNSEGKLKQYEIMKNNDTFNILSGIVQQKGLTVEEVLSALQTGDLLSLQEQMESSGDAELETSENEEQHEHKNSENGETYYKTY